MTDLPSTQEKALELMKNTRGVFVRLLRQEWGQGEKRTGVLNREPNAPDRAGVMEMGRVRMLVTLG